VNDDAPIELYGYHAEYDGVILARREGEPSFVWVQDLGDAIQAAMARNVDIVVSVEMLANLRASGDLPLNWLPRYIVVR
jgi:hypothetical protein